MNQKIIVYYAEVRNYYDDLIEKIPHSERQRTLKATNSKRKKLLILGRALLAEALTVERGCSDFEMTYHHAKGKPLLRRPGDWHFNITHSGEHIFLALRQYQAIGIDSEIVRNRPDYQRIADKFFDVETRQNIANAKDPMLAFYRYWTSYEAQIKYCGSSVFSDIPEDKKLNVNSFTIEGDKKDKLVISLCSESSMTDIQFFHTTFEKNSSFQRFAPAALF